MKQRTQWTYYYDVISRSAHVEEKIDPSLIRFSGTKTKPGTFSHRKKPDLSRYKKGKGRHVIWCATE